MPEFVAHPHTCQSIDATLRGRERLARRAAGDRGPPATAGNSQRLGHLLGQRPVPVLRVMVTEPVQLLSPAFAVCRS